jgi:predicted Zn-dependent peptidase
MAKVTAADVQRVAREYLTKSSRTVVLTVPKPAAPKGGL